MEQKKTRKFTARGKMAKQKRKPALMKFDPETLKRIERLAAAYGMSQSRLVENFIPDGYFCDLICEFQENGQTLFNDPGRAVQESLILILLEFLLHHPEHPVDPEQIPRAEDKQTWLDLMTMLALVWRRAIDHEPGYKIVEAKMIDKDGEIKKIVQYVSEAAINKHADGLIKAAKAIKQSLGNAIEVTAEEPAEEKETYE